MHQPAGFGDAYWSGNTDSSGRSDRRKRCAMPPVESGTINMHIPFFNAPAAGDELDNAANIAPHVADIG